MTTEPISWVRSHVAKVVFIAMSMTALPCAQFGFWDYTCSPKAGSVGTSATKVEMGKTAQPQKNHGSQVVPKGQEDQPGYFC